MKKEIFNILIGPVFILTGYLISVSTIMGWLMVSIGILLAIVNTSFSVNFWILYTMNLKFKNTPEPKNQWDCDYTDFYKIENQQGSMTLTNDYPYVGKPHKSYRKGGFVSLIGQEYHITHNQALVLIKR